MRHNACIREIVAGCVKWSERPPGHHFSCNEQLGFTQLSAVNFLSPFKLDASEAQISVMRACV